LCNDNVFIPLQADVAQIVSSGKLLFEKYLKTGYNSYQILYKSRYNNSLSREVIIRSVADAVADVNPLNTVNLTDPKYVVVVEVLKNICCLSVITDFNKFRKYNLIEASNDPKAEKGDDEPSPRQKQHSSSKGDMDVDGVNDPYEICFDKDSMDDNDNNDNDNAGTASSVSRGQSISSESANEGKEGPSTILDK